jgi:16S rRNA (adenine1518-N6/adenine1519-N6)-dimethyltransferase
MSEAPQARSEIRALLRAHGLSPNKRLGQNFLADPNIVRRIVEEADVSGELVVEVGAGTGTLTTALASEAELVVAYELDRGLVDLLADTVGHLANVDIRQADAASVVFSHELDGHPWTMVANLPYNVGTGIILDVLRHAPSIERLVVMVQSEVADRLLSEPGSRTYGLPSVVVGLHATGRRLFSVPPQVFEPAPRVGSAVVLFNRTSSPRHAERAIEIAGAGFGQRRKMLRRSLASLMTDPSAILDAAGVDPTARAEQLTPMDYVAIARAEENP